MFYGIAISRLKYSGYERSPMHSEIEKLAKLITEYSVEVSQGDRVLIDGDPTGARLLYLCLHKEILKKGGIPFHKLTLGDCDYLNLIYGKEFQFRSFAEDDRRIIENTDILIGIQASMNPRRIDRVSPEKILEFSRATRIVREVVYERFKAGKLKLLYVEYPTNGEAQSCGMSVVEYENRFCRACFLDKKNPIREWKRLSEKQEGLVKFLERKDTISVEGEGTDLTFSTKGRKWTSDDGRRYLPDGEVYVEGPAKDSVNGSIMFNYPGIFKGKEIKDIRIEFRDGKIVKAESSTEEKFLQDLLAVNTGRVYMSAFGIGTNYRIDSFIGHMAFDEKMGGTIHLALRGSPLWVLLKGMGKDEKIYADDELFYENGNLTI